MYSVHYVKNGKKKLKFIDSLLSTILFADDPNIQVMYIHQIGHIHMVVNLN
jgi:hypothetical protein